MREAVIFNAEAIDGFAVGLRQIAKLSAHTHRAGNFLTGKKADGSPLSEIDTLNQRLLTELVFDCFGRDLVIVGEEDSVGTVYPEHRIYVYVDPVDGTSPLAAGFPDTWNLLVGFVIDGQPVLGFMANPRSDFVLFGGQAMDGVCILDCDGKRTFAPLAILPQNKLWGMDMATGVAQDLFQAELNRRLVADRAVGGYPRNVPSGQSGIDLLMGHTKFWMSGNAMPWDLCPMHAIGLLLGVVVRYVDGSEIDWRQPSRTKLKPFILADSLVSYDAVKKIYDQTWLTWSDPKRQAAIKVAWQD